MPSSRSISRTGRSRRATFQLPSPMWLISTESSSQSIAYISLKLRVADQRLGGAHQRRGVRVALGGVAVAVRHQVRGGEQRQLLEAPVAADRVEVEREARDSRCSSSSPRSATSIRAA